MSIESEAQALLARAVQTLEHDVEKLIHPAEFSAAAAVKTVEADVTAEVKTEDAEVKKEVAAVETKAEAEVKAAVAEVTNVRKQLVNGVEYLGDHMTIAWKDTTKKL